MQVPIGQVNMHHCYKLDFAMVAATEKTNIQTGHEKHTQIKEKTNPKS